MEEIEEVGRGHLEDVFLRLNPQDFADILDVGYERKRKVMYDSKLLLVEGSFLLLSCGKLERAALRGWK